MFRNFEKSVTFIANLISIITFLLSIFNWLDFSFIANVSIPTERAAKCILVLYCCLASYGQGQALDEHTESNENSTLLWIMLSFSYVFGFLFLLEKAKPVLSFDNNQLGPITLAWTANVFIMYFVYFFKRVYPKGGIIGFFRNYFKGFKATLLWFLHMALIGVLFSVLK